jgi:hypothetical protein
MMERVIKKKTGIEPKIYIQEDRRKKIREVNMP